MAPSLLLAAIVLFASWMGSANGGYFVGDWAPVALILAALMLAASLFGALDRSPSWWSAASTGLLVAYTTWVFVSLLWSPNQGDAWVGVGQTLLYLLVFWATTTFVGLGASRRWVLVASVVGPGLVAALTLPTLIPHVQDMFRNDRLLGTVGYYNGEAAFLLVPFWVSVYLSGSRRVNPLVRGVVLAGAVLSTEVAILAQSRGAMVAMAVSLPVFFLFSGKRLRGLLALIPIVVALFVAFPGLNDVYREFVEGGSPAAALEQVTPTIWLTAAGAGLYGLLWGLIDWRWRPPVGIVRVTGGIAFAGVLLLLTLGGVTVKERVGDPIAWGEQRWEAFKSNDNTGLEQSRYLSASGRGRYMLWQIAYDDFTSHPLLGVGTHNYEATYYQKREQAIGFVRQPHMLPLEVLAERGVIGGLLFFGFLGVCSMAGLLKRFRHLKAEGKAQVGALLATLSYWFVHSSAEWFWQIPAVTLPAIVYLAMLVAPWGGTRTAPVSWPLRAIGAGVAVAAIVAVVPLYVADNYLARSQTATNPRVGLMAVERAQDYNPVDPSLPQREAELAIRIGDWPRVKDSYSRAIELNPEHYAPYYLLALSHEKVGEYEKALSLYRKTSALNPLDPSLDRHASQVEAKIAAD